MSKKLQRLILATAIMGLAIFFGCASMKDLIIPAYIPPASLEYSGSEPTTLLPFTTLFDLKRVDMKMDFVYATSQMTEKLKYKFLKGVNYVHISASEELREAVFSPSGPIALMFPMLLGGTVGSLLISKPEDKKKIKELEKANGK